MAKALWATAAAMVHPEAERGGRGKGEKVLAGLDGKDRRTMQMYLQQARAILAFSAELAAEMVAGVPLGFALGTVRGRTGRWR